MTPGGAPYRLAYLSSCRWVDTDGGGILELLVALLGTTGPFAETFRLEAVLVDDDDEQYAHARAQRRLWPGDLTVPDGRTLDELTCRIPSQWWKDLRAAPGEDAAAIRARRAEAKAEYERRVVAELSRRRIDLVLVDSYLTIAGPTLLAAYEGLLLNVHPAVLGPGDPARLPGRTPTRDTFTRAAYGIVVVDDKKGEVPAGERVTVRSDGVPREAVRVPALRTAGVTVHVVTADVDAGPVVACERWEIGDDELSYGAIRARNRSVKERVVPAALLGYAGRPEVRERIARLPHRGS